MPPTLSPLTFEELRYLIEWPADLIYGDLTPIAAAEIDTSWHRLSSHYQRTKADTSVDTSDWRSPKPFDPPAKDIRGTRELVEWTNLAPTHQAPGAPSPIPDALTATIARPTAAAFARTQHQTFRPNPFKHEEFEADYTDYSDRDESWVIEGAYWALSIASRTFFNAELLPRSTIELLTPSGAAQTLRGHALREQSPDFIQRTFQGIYQQYDDLDLTGLRSTILREISRWQDIGRSAVIRPDGEIDMAISLINAETAKVVISKILEKLRQLNGFVAGAGMVML